MMLATTKYSHLACNNNFNRSHRAWPQSRKAFRVCSIGFDLTGSTSSKSAEKSADELSRAASSMLIYRNVLSTKAAQSFMDTLLHLQKGSPNKLLEHYSDLFKAISNEGYSSWEEYLLDQVLRGADNPFSRAAAKNEAVEVARLFPSAKHDIGIIRQLSLVSENTLVGWVRETVSSVSDEWMLAATALNNIPDNGAAVEPFEIPNDAPAHILAPLNKNQRAEMRNRLRQELQVEERVAEMLQKYHAAHDYGILSMHRVLKWNQDRLQAQDVLEGVVSTASTTGEIEKSAADVLAAALDAGLLSLDLTSRNQGAEPILIEGCARSTYTLAMHVLNNLKSLVTPEHTASAAAVRTIILPNSQLSSISELAWTMSQHPRMYFAVICPGVSENISADVAATIAGGDGVSWPSNAVFIGCCNVGPEVKSIPGIRISL